MIKHISQVFSLPLESHTDKLVLLAIADNADDNGFCWPSINTIARKCSLNRATVINRIASLIQAGLLTKITGHTGYSNRYQLTLGGSRGERLPSRGERLPLVAENDPKHHVLTTNEAPRQLLSQKAAQLEADYPLTAEYRPDVIELAAKGRDINGKLLFNVEKYMARFEAAIESNRSK
jgi:DNA-binding Lrp family transcriptional regulator